MESSKSRKYESTYKLVRHHNLVTETDVPSRLMCEHCKLILIDSCQVPCGCKYCRYCIEEMVANGCRVCSGITPGCKDGNLADCVTDFSTNREIENLVLTCPEPTCNHQCKLIKMVDHLRLCSMKSANCPFQKIGCEYENVANHKWNEHLILEAFNHNTILIEMINNVKNDVEALKRDLSMKNETIATLDKELNLVKFESREQLERSQQNEENYKSEIEILNRLLITNKKRIAKIKTENDTIAATQAKEIESIHRDIQVGKESLDKTLGMIKDKNKKHKKQITKINDDMDYLQRQIDKMVFEWNILGVAKMREKDKITHSDYFYPRKNRYKMRLRLWNDAHELFIRFCIYPSENDACLIWPFKRKVTIKIVNKAKPDKCSTVRKYCNICKSDSLSYKFSDPFTFSYAELSKAGLLHNNNLTIECYLD